MDAECINITVENNVLTICGEKQERTEKKNGGEHTERRYGSFARSVSLPKVVDVKKIAATYRDGTLEVLLPNVPEAKPQKIQITAKQMPAGPAPPSSFGPAGSRRRPRALRTPRERLASHVWR